MRNKYLKLNKSFFQIAVLLFILSAFIAIPNKVCNAFTLINISLDSTFLNASANHAGDFQSHTTIGQTLDQYVNSTTGATITNQNAFFSSGDGTPDFLKFIPTRDLSLEIGKFEEIGQFLFKNGSTQPTSRLDHIEFKITGGTGINSETREIVVINPMTAFIDIDHSLNETGLVGIPPLGDDDKWTFTFEDAIPAIPGVSEPMDVKVPAWIPEHDYLPAGTDLLDVDVVGTINETSSVSISIAGFRLPKGSPITLVPEPTTIVLLGIGIVGLAGCAARQRFKNKKNQ